MQENTKDKKTADAESAPKMITLLSDDGVAVNVDFAVMKRSPLIRNMFEDLGVSKLQNALVPIPTASGVALRKIVEYCDHHRNDPISVAADGPENNDSRAGAIPTPKSISMEKWDSAFIKLDQQTLCEIVMAANFLELKSLLDMACMEIAAIIKGCNTPEEIRETFGITNDITPEEMEQLRARNKWAEEKI